MGSGAASLALSRHPTVHPLRQRKIKDYLTPFVNLEANGKKSPDQLNIQKTSFIDLPQHVREKIYDEAHIGGNKFIDLNFWSVNEATWRDLEDFPVYKSPPTPASRYLQEESFPAGLLRVGSRLIQDEVQAKLYAQNTFAVSLHGPGGLEPLEHLSNAALREVRVLIVSLCPCKCLTPFCSKINWNRGECVVWPRPRSEYFWDPLKRVRVTHRRSLGCVSRTDRTTLACWRRICARLASNTQPRHLKLYLTAQPADNQTAHAILEPLREFPELKDIAINLGTHLGASEARSLARDAVLQLTKAAYSGAFRFMDLPTELQVDILRHTGLIDERFLDWSPSERLISQASWRPCDSDGPSQEHPSRSPDVFCLEKNSGAFNAGCECYDSSLPFFRVSKAFAKVSRSVFYGYNEFRLYPNSRRHTGRIAGYDAFDGDGHYEISLASFLRRTPQQYIAYLSHVVIILPTMTPDFLQPAGWDRWVDSINTLKRLAHLPRLKLEIHFSDQNPLPDTDVVPHTFQQQSLQARRIRNPVLERAMRDTYMRIIEPLKMLGSELGALLVYVAWPVCESEDGHRDRKVDERMLEKMVMGEKYESAKWRKREQSPYCQIARYY